MYLTIHDFYSCMVHDKNAVSIVDKNTPCLFAISLKTADLLFLIDSSLYLHVLYYFLVLCEIVLEVVLVNSLPSVDHSRSCCLKAGLRMAVSTH